MSVASVGFTMHLPDLLLSAGIGLLSLLLLMNLRFKLARRAAVGSRSRTTPSTSEDLWPTQSAEHDITQRLSPALRDSLIGAHDIAKDLLGQVETRCRTLEILICQADQRIGQLEQAIDAHVGASISPGKAAADANNSRQHSDPGTSDRLTLTSNSASVEYGHRDSNEPCQESRQCEVAGSVDSLDPHLRPQRSIGIEAVVPVEPLLVNVYELADRGKNAVEIARHLDEQIGKVELILALRQ